MRVIITAGGTGGHIYPALAIVNQIKKQEPESEFLYIGTHNRMEKEIVPKAGIPFETIEIYGFYRKEIWKNVKTIRKFFESYRICKKKIKEFQPDIVVGVGGYVTGPVLYAAHKLHVPTLIHEQNSIPGKANLFLSHFVDQIAISFPKTKEYFKNSHVTFTGNPCSEDAIQAKKMDKKELGFHENKKLVLFVMGSLGSTKVNEYLLKTMSLFNGKDYEILFVTGKESYEEIKKLSFPKNVKVVPYIEGLPRVMKSSDLIVSRAGASTLSEIIALELPSILIPSPYVPNNHQLKNAMELVNAKGAVLIEEKELKGDRLVRTIDELLREENTLKEMKTSLKSLQIKNSAEQIYQMMKALVKSSS